MISAQEDDHLLLATSTGQVIRFAVGDVRAMGRAAAGVAGINLTTGAAVVAASVVPGGDDDGRQVATVARDGRAKRTPLAEYPAQGRGGKGVLAGAQPLAWCGLATDLHAVSGEQAVVVRPVELAPVRRSGAPEPGALPGAVTGPVVAEVHRD